MNYFTIKRSIFIVSSNKCCEEYEKIDKFIEILNKSNIGILIEKEIKCNSRTGYNPYNLVATIIYCFSKFKSSIRDYYSKLSHDFHAGYNIQVMVSSGLITMYGVFQDRSDHYTFIPMNNLYFKYYMEYPENECADSGYGIYINYRYMREHNIGNYVKFQTWSGEADGKRPQLFYTFTDGVLCLNTCIGKVVPFNSDYHQRNEGGKLYKFTGCDTCNYSYICKKNVKNKELDYRLYELVPDYELLKEQVRVNLLSPKGIEIRINRSIQVEGTFGQLKQNMQYVRIRRRGIEKVSCEIMLMCLGRNIRKYFTLLDSDKIKSNYWDKPNDLKTEKLPFPKQKISKKKAE